MKNIIQINKFAFLDDRETILFCKTDYIAQLFQYLDSSPRECTIITGNSDYEVTEHLASCAPSCIKRWYAQNANVTDSRIHGIPIGIENTKDCIIHGHGVGWEHAKQKEATLSKVYDIQPSEYIYANFSVDTHPSRSDVAKICETIKFVSTSLSSNHLEINSKSYEKYVQDILKHHMTVCPRGNGIDCHRIWEVLYLGRVPIVKKEKALQYFEELPILFIDDWSQLKDSAFIETRYNEVKTNRIEMLDMNYWNEKILFGI